MCPGRCESLVCTVYDHRIMIVMVDNYDSFTYNLVQYLGELGADVRVFRNDKISGDEIAAMEPFQVGGSPGVNDFVDELAGNGIQTLQLLHNQPNDYYIDNDPAPIMVCQPRDLDAKKFSQSRIAPMIRDCPSLAAKVADAEEGFAAMFALAAFVMQL